MLEIVHTTSGGLIYNDSHDAILVHNKETGDISFLNYNKAKVLLSLDNTPDEVNVNVNDECDEYGEGKVDEPAAPTTCERNNDRDAALAKKWSDHEIFLLIRTIEQHYSDFNVKLKKQVFDDIAQEMNKVLHQQLTGQQIDTKWKGLKGMYKKVKTHNDTSGNAPKSWKFFNAMDMFLAKKPEINPLALASSSTDNVELAVSEGEPKKKKKKDDDVERRHQETLQRQDRFLELFEQLVHNRTKTNSD